MTPFMKSLLKNIDDLYKSNLWDEIKPDGIDPRASEYITQAHADLVRCEVNLKRADGVMGCGDGKIQADQ